MTQSTTETSAGYFALNHPVIKPSNNKIAKSDLLNRRQQQSSAYLQQLELPSLPPLSQLIPNSKIKKTEPIKPSTELENPEMLTVASIYHPLQQQPIYFNNDFNQPQPPLNTLLMDPVNFPSSIPLDPMYSNTIESDPTTVMMSQAGLNPTSQPGYLYNPPMVPQEQPRTRQMSSSSASSAEKIYSFVAIPGTNQKKRPRRRYDEIERLYHCNWPGCTKAYGTLNHLNAHVSMQKHGPKRHPAEFKEMRKEWRRQKKEREAHKKRNEDIMKQQQQVLTTNVNNPSFSSMPYGQLSTGPMPLNGFY
ncbi:hypothetical protein EDC96DRAFT_491800 [Choanephora cucurbitarum]|nr:hypothetical protein EDC96DRAFT_491800 [Choanephora cucurbitarum]